MQPTAASHSQVRVPFLDLHASHEPLSEALLEDIAGLIETGAFTNGPDVARFEQAFASFCGRAHCVGVASGLDALRLGLVALGLEPGDEVIIPANTFVATAEAVTQAGGAPVLVDVTDADYNVNPEAVAAAIGPRTRFLMPVHLYGQLADMRAVTGIAERAGVAVIEDACQAHGAIRDGLAAGGVGAVAAFSFYPGKNLGAFGDAGALVTDSCDVADCTRALREHGQRTKYHHDLVGWTSRLDTIQALALLHKLPELDRWNDERRAAAAFYLDRLDGLGDLVLPHVPTGSTPVWHLYVIRTADPSGLAAFLAERGVGCGRHYPQPIHLTQAYAHLGRREGEFPVSERLGRECLSLPMFPGIREEQLDAVVESIRAYFSAVARASRTPPNPARGPSRPLTDP